MADPVAPAAPASKLTTAEHVGLYGVGALAGVALAPIVLPAAGAALTLVGAGAVVSAAATSLGLTTTVAGSALAGGYATHLWAKAKGLI